MFRLASKDIDNALVAGYLTQLLGEGSGGTWEQLVFLITILPPVSGSSHMSLMQDRVG